MTPAKLAEQYTEASEFASFILWRLLEWGSPSEAFDQIERRLEVLTDPAPRGLYAAL